MPFLLPIHIHGIQIKSLPHQVLSFVGWGFRKHMKHSPHHSILTCQRYSERRVHIGQSKFVSPSCTGYLCCVCRIGPRNSPPKSICHTEFDSSKSDAVSLQRGSLFTLRDGWEDGWEEGHKSSSMSYHYLGRHQLSSFLACPMYATDRHTSETSDDRRQMRIVA